MKFFGLRQSHVIRRSGSQRGGLMPLESSMEGTMFPKSASAMLWLCAHCICCLISLVLGFRFSRLLFVLLLSGSSATVPIANPSRYLVAEPGSNINPPIILPPRIDGKHGNNSRKVVAGRHGILIRPWPHPDPIEVMRAHEIIRRVQEEQRLQFGVKDPRSVIVVTPTYVRTFQKMHLTGLMHTLMLVPYKVIWILVEANGPTNETASIVTNSGIHVIHIGFPQVMPPSWEGRHRLEVKMRIRALREVRKLKLDGLVLFGDDSNVHSMELFDDIQKVKWFGAFSVGVLIHSTDDEPSNEMMENGLNALTIPVLGPVCNTYGSLVGWHKLNMHPYEGKTAVYIDDVAAVLPKELEWAGFVINSRLLWSQDQDIPKGFKELETLGEDVTSPMSLVNDPSLVKPLGHCSRQVKLWWLRVEARSDSKFPRGWIIDHPLEIVVPSKETPWSDAQPQLPSEILADGHSEAADSVRKTKRSSKSRSSRSKRRSKRRREANVGDKPANSSSWS